MFKASDMRQTFLTYFQNKGHQLVPSSGLVPEDDPTLLFTNAGMNQFKNIFTGIEKASYDRAVSSQKCLRAGGKHNDLENVGFTARHHTFFEMMGNFSFGNYFKEEAIFYAWDLLTNHFHLPPEKLLITYYQSDLEAKKLWQKISGLPDSRLIPISTTDNFWSMGPTGPCGPCSEIFYDHGDKIPGGIPGSPEEDGDRFVEIWNLVFMQYNQDDTGALTALPQQSIDTGMGLERLAAILQGVHNNYDTDVFQNLIMQSQNIYGEIVGTDALFSHRVLADHIRSVSFLIADGVSPSNEGRGYVLRRIMRRAMRHAHQLGAREPLFWQLASPLITVMSPVFPELQRAQEYIEETVRVEETKFQNTLQEGLSLLQKETARLGETETLPGEIAFKLFDTYGFPVDLTQSILAPQRQVDLDGFNAAMAAQKEIARSSWKGTAGTSALDTHLFTILNENGATRFTGYETTQDNGNIQGLFQDDAKLEAISHKKSSPDSTQSSENPDPIYLVTNQTPFYGESGGQLGDAGHFETETGAGRITDTRKAAGGKLTVHTCIIDRGTLKTGQHISLSVDLDRRRGLQAHHSATHLLHQALQQHLGNHVVQKGSLVAPDRLRFDFSAAQAIPQETLAAISRDINVQIQENTLVTHQLMSPEAAREQGAQALFGEKYGAEVRVVSMGLKEKEQTIGDGAEAPYSQELCGGTHVTRTGEIGLFHLISDSAIGSGVRRIEAVVSQGALTYLNKLEATLQKTALLLKTKQEDVPERVEKLLSERRLLEKSLKTASKSAGTGVAQEQLNTLSFVTHALDDTPPGELRGMAEQLRKQHDTAIIVVATQHQKKGAIVVTVTANLTNRYNAIELAQCGARVLGGTGGGGRPDMAQAGGPHGEHVKNAIRAIRAAIVALQK